MILRDLRIQFKKTIPVSDGFLKLMQQTFGFYSSLCNDFFANLGSHVESSTLSNYLQGEIRPRLFNADHCKNIEKIKKDFLAENIKLEQFIAKNDFDQDVINDLSLLKKVSESIYELLQTHWEFFKYEKSVASNEAIIAFILEIDRIGIKWDSYLEKYLAVSGVLKAAGAETKKEGYAPLVIQYHLPEEAEFNIDLCSNLFHFLQLTYEFVLKVHDKAEKTSQLEITNVSAGNPVYCELLVPEQYIQSFTRFLKYLTVDVLKRETLVKFVMEIVRLQQGKEMAKQAITNFQKKISKQLESLHPEGYFSLNEDDAEDSVNLLTMLCEEMERLKVQYKDMMTGSTNRLARNKVKPLSQLSIKAKKIEEPSNSKEESDEKTRVPAPPSDTSEKKTAGENTMSKESTVKINVKNKEHIQYLTS